MNYSDLLSPRQLSRRAKRTFNHSVIDDIKNSVSKVEISTSSLVAISAAASIGAGLAFYFLNKRQSQAESNQRRADSYIDRPRDQE